MQCNLSEHFTLGEFIWSDTARRLGIDNTPPDAIVEALRGTAERMERVRAILGAPIHVSSGFRCEALERALTQRAFRAWCERHGKPVNDDSWGEYFSRKAHPKGRAVDFIAPAFGSPLEVARALARYSHELDFDQLIHEFRDWVHIGWGSTPRRQLLTVDTHGTRQGLV